MAAEAPSKLMAPFTWLWNGPTWQDECLAAERALLDSVGGNQVHHRHFVSCLSWSCALFARWKPTRNSLQPMPHKRITPNKNAQIGSMGRRRVRYRGCARHRCGRAALRAPHRRLQVQLSPAEAGCFIWLFNQRWKRRRRLQQWKRWKQRRTRRGPGAAPTPPTASDQGRQRRRAPTGPLARVRSGRRVLLAEPSWTRPMPPAPGDTL